LSDVDGDGSYVRIEILIEAAPGSWAAALADHDSPNRDITLLGPETARW